MPMTRKFLLFYLKEHEKISGLAVYSNTLSLLVAELFTKILSTICDVIRWIHMFIEYKT